MKENKKANEKMFSVKKKKGGLPLKQKNCEAASDHFMERKTCTRDRTWEDLE